MSSTAVDSDIIRYKLTQIAKKRTLRMVETAALAAAYLQSHIDHKVAMKPDIILAGIPLYSLQQEGHASSDEILKYRAMGGIFLAHQQGGKRTFIFKAILTGPSRHLILGLFKGLLWAGRQDTPLGSPKELGKIGKKITNPALKPEMEISVEERYITSFQAAEKETILYHRTFPIITFSKIYTNMYIETLRFTSDIKILGTNSIEIHCACRQFIPPLHAEVKRITDKEKKHVATYFTTFLTEKQRIFYQRYIDIIINIGWGMTNVIKEALEAEKRQMAEAFSTRITAELGAFIIGSIFLLYHARG